MTAKEFLRRANALAKARRCALSTISRTVFPKNPRAIDRLAQSLKRKTGGPSVVDFEQAVALLEKLERESTNGHGKGV